MWKLSICILFLSIDIIWTASTDVSYQKNNDVLEEKGDEDSGWDCYHNYINSRSVYKLTTF